MELDLHRLWIFMQVVEHRGFSAAAQKLYMSQPSVSNQVRRLEESLRTTLIDRSGGRIRPTAEGQVLDTYGKRVFLLAEEAVAAVQQLSGLQTGRIVVGGSTTVGTYLLPDLLAAYRSRHPSVEGHIFVGNNKAVIEQLLSGGVGIAVVAGAPADQRLVSETVLEERLVMVAAPGHPLAGIASLTADMFAGERLILREPGSQTRELQESTLGSWGLTEASWTEVWGPEAVKRCVAAGLGISLISEHAVADDVRSGTLALLEVEQAAQARPITLLRRRDRLLSAAEQAFVQLLRDQPAWPLRRVPSQPAGPGK
ncbi:LysR family transcriptional regulator [Streptomyces sp. NBC_01210]|uniref:LysR family transcriptional regulator n=1 Tax=Streptomyces sp. NBC_01210 TaxID=2903774 RepID=UPI002E1073B5|nr:LysR family transcriptional regulator [Streptomyces sp. NBC_01210]